MSFDAIEDDEEEWIPMVQDDQIHTQDEPPAKRLDKSPTREAYSIPGKSQPIDDSLHSNPAKKSKSENMRSQARNVDTDSNARLLQIQNKLQDRISIQTHLVDRPLDFFWQRCLINLLRQMWTLEIRIQVGILMLATGLFMRVILWSTWYLLYPRFAILLSIFVASLVYLDPFDLHNQLKGVWNMLEALFSSAPSQQGKVEGIDTNKLRTLSLALFMVPTILEIRTLSFLSRINAGLVLQNTVDSGSNEWTTISLYGYNFGVAVCIFSVMLFLRRKRRINSCDVSYRGLLILYGFSLLIIIISYERNVANMRQIPALAAPFLTATATLLLMYKDDGYEWLSRIVRQAFRLSLRDVFSMVSERVTDDDMLQLAILRWICDFWATSSASADTQSTGASKTETSSTTPQDPVSSSTKPSQSSESTSEIQTFRHDSIQWEELQPMLNIEIDHMETEIDALQTYAASSSTQGKHEDSDSSKPNSSVNQENDHPLVGLKSMLLSFDVDERAQPAVLAFRRAVEAFPPNKKTAVTISILRRCPALLTMMIHILFLSGTHSLFVTSLVLFPFAVFEYYRILEWMELCQQVESRSSKEIEKQEEQNDWRIPEALRSVDSMTVLLSGDESMVIRPPSLLIVWYNVVSSVSALEMGLSTARCVETTAVAVEFAGSAMSLVKFGLEVSDKGLLHGAMILAGEMLTIYGNGKDIGNLDMSDNRSAKYTSAAVRTVHYGQKIVKNVHTISEDQNILSFAQPVLNFLSIFTGGKEEKADNEIPQLSETNHDLHLNEQKNTEHTDLVTGSTSKVDVNTEDDELSTSDEIGEGATNDENLEDTSPMLPANSNSLSNASVPDEDLSELMEMIATAYEQGLIDQHEKDDFFKKLSGFQVEELRDPSMLSAMKRTLNIVLDNGSMVSIISDSDPGSSNAVDEQSEALSVDRGINDDIAATTPDNDSCILPESEREFVDDKTEKKPDVSQSDEQGNDFIALGVAALGVIASGVALSMRNDSKPSDHKQHNFATEDNTDQNVTNQDENNTERSSTIDIVELTDQGTENEWVSLDS